MHLFMSSCVIKLAPPTWQNPLHSVASTEPPRRNLHCNGVLFPLALGNNNTWIIIILPFAAFKLGSEGIKEILTSDLKTGWVLEGHTRHKCNSNRQSKMEWVLEEHFSKGETEVQSDLNNPHVSTERGRVRLTLRCLMTCFTFLESVSKMKATS